MLYGNSDNRMAFCLRPGMETVTRISDVPGVTFPLSRPTIAAQCCTPNGQCRRHVSGQCIGGFSGDSSRGDGGLDNDPWVKPMTYSETKASCAAKGLVMCQQSCKNKGCWYNLHAVYTDKPCPASSPSPPPPALSPPNPSPINSPSSPSRTPLPPPPSPSPPPPLIVHGAWAEDSASLFKTSGEAEETFLQKCLAFCQNKGDDCVGFVVKPMCTNGGKCCTMHKAITPFFSTSAETYVKRNWMATAAGMGRSAKVESSNPGWTYDASEDDDDDSVKLAWSADSVKLLQNKSEPAVDSSQVEPAAAGLGIGALVGLAVALAVSGMLIGSAITLGVQRCRANGAAKTGKEKYTTAAEKSVSEVSIAAP